MEIQIWTLYEQRVNQCSDPQREQQLSLLSWFKSKLYNHHHLHPEIIIILVIVVIKILKIIKLHCAIRAEMPVASQHQSWLPAPAVLVHASR